MKPYTFVIFISWGLLFSCSNHENVVHVKADHVNGLNTESIVTINGIEVGQVNEIDLDKNGKVLLKLNLDTETNIPIDSKFSIETRDLFGSKGISIERGKSNTNISVNDTVTLSTESTFQSDSLIIKVQDLFENLVGAKQRDSILIELRRLNENLEERSNNQ
jgi:ABC-type transporter Mla subunit MlaD